MQPASATRKKQCCCECDSFPNEAIIEYLTIQNAISQIRFCSLPDERGALPAAPQLIERDEPWVGGVCMFLVRGEVNGYTEQRWERVLNSVLMRPRAVDAKGKKYLWISFLEGLDPSDVRAEELRKNVIQTKCRTDTDPGYMSPRTSEASTRKEAEALSRATQEAKEECERAEQAVAARVAAMSSQEGVVELTTEAMLELKQLSWRAVKTYIETRFEQDKSEYFAGQPHGKRRRARDYSLKSKKPRDAQQARGLNEGTKQRTKTSKSVTFAQGAGDGREEEEPAGGGGGLTITERVAQRAMSEPEGGGWKAKLLVFLQSPDALSRGRRSSSAWGVLRAILPQDCLQVPYFQLKRGQGLGWLYPSPEKDKDPAWPSALELHRCVLAVEGVAQRLLRACAGALQPEGVARLSGEDKADLQLAWMFRGGICGEGPSFWPQEAEGGLFPLAGVQPSEGGLLNTLRSLRAGRADAFRRDYLIVDEVTWCMPYLAKVFFLRAEAPGASAALQREVKLSFERLTTFRQHADRADKGRLVAYGTLLLDYADRLSALAGVLLPPEEGPDATAVQRSRQAIAKAAASMAKAPPPDPDTVVRYRLNEEEREARSVLDNLGVPPASALALEKARRIREAVREAMAGDSHRKNATEFLHPSPSLDYAVFDPERYL